MPAGGWEGILGVMPFKQHQKQVRIGGCEGEKRHRQRKPLCGGLEPDCCGPEADEMLGGLEPASKVKIAGLSSEGRSGPGHVGSRKPLRALWLLLSGDLRRDGRVLSRGVS